jgi:tripartite ATP-independent transporter DctM subunit
MAIIGLLALVFLVLAIFAVPVAIALAAASLVIILFWPVPHFLFAQKMINGVDSYPLLAIPFFILAASIMNMGGVTPRIVDLLNAVLGRVRGSLGYVNVGASMFLSGISGSSVADASAIGTIMIPSMRRAGYSTAFAAALTAGAAIMGPIIPPSISLVVFGVVAQVSILKLFMAAYLPGLIIALALSAYVFFYARKHDLPRSGSVSGKELLARLRRGVWALSMPIMLVVGVRGGYFTVTELGAVLVFYGLFVGWLIHREFRWVQFPQLLIDTGMQTANIMLIIATSSFFAYLTVIHGVPQEVQAALQGMEINSVEFLLLVNVIFLIAGMFLDSTPATIVLVPILLPTAKALGIDMTHFGIVVVFNLMIGLIHPPLGLNLMITSTIAREPLWRVVIASLPILGIMLGLLLLFTFVPSIVMYLPDMAGM